MLANLVFGNRPTFVGIRAFGFVPFFSIDPNIHCGGNGASECQTRNGADFAGGPAAAYAIFTAGFSVQHITDEGILRTHHNLRFENAPFGKGMLLFNIATSVVYASAAWLGKEDGHGDLNNAARVSGIPHGVLAAFIFLPAMLDGIRYLKPQWTIVPSVACASKYALLGTGFMF